jgi:hypothetical protein
MAVAVIFSNQMPKAENASLAALGSRGSTFGGAFLGMPILLRGFGEAYSQRALTVLLWLISPIKEAGLPSHSGHSRARNNLVRSILSPQFFFHYVFDWQPSDAVTSFLTHCLCG